MHACRGSVKAGKEAHSVNSSSAHTTQLTALTSSNKTEICSPLNTSRLQPTRHRTRNAILSILETGEVCFEFLKKRSRGEEKVVDVCRISADGIRVSALN